jgi:hypothetical protein
LIVIVSANFIFIFLIVFGLLSLHSSHDYQHQQTSPKLSIYGDGEYLMSINEVNSRKTSV